MKTIDFEFELREKVNIPGLAREGVVIGLYFGGSGIEYNIVYNDEGVRRKDYFYPFELEHLKEKNDKGLLNETSND